jgi:hypothetical protein
MEREKERVVWREKNNKKLFKKEVEEKTSTTE